MESHIKCKFGGSLAHSMYSQQDNYGVNGHSRFAQYTHDTNKSQYLRNNRSKSD